VKDFVLKAEGYGFPLFFQRVPAEGINFGSLHNTSQMVSWRIQNLLGTFEECPRYIEIPCGWWFYCFLTNWI
jgi:hypothetical protein